MLKSKITPFIVSSMIAVSASAAESDLSYNYVAVGYQQGEVLDEDFGGIGAGISIALSESFFLLGAYSDLESDDKFFGDEIGVTTYNFGIGFHTPIAESVDFVTSLSYANVEAETQGVSIDGDGYLVAAGVRAKPTDILELGASINYADIEDEGETGFGVNARVFATPAISIGLSYGSADDVDTYGVDARFSF